jgi:two-component system cell cycle sensor histidine kinase/response regulator CckA
VRAVGERILCRQGYRVYACANGDEALATVNAIAEPIALVITDVVMPGMNGRVLSERLKAIRPGLRVLYTSGYTEDLIVDHGVVDGGIEFLAKPYSPTVLANRVRELLGG